MFMLSLLNIFDFELDVIIFCFDQKIPMIIVCFLYSLRANFCRNETHVIKVDAIQ